MLVCYLYAKRKVELVYASATLLCYHSTKDFVVNVSALHSVALRVR